MGADRRNAVYADKRFGILADELRQCLHVGCRTGGCFAMSEVHSFRLGVCAESIKNLLACRSLSPLDLYFHNVKTIGFRHFHPALAKFSPVDRDDRISR